MKTDWRSKPRKPSAQKRIVQISGKATLAEAATIRAAARAAEMTLADYVICRCLGKRTR